jgi:hypothetical protein
MNEIKVVRSVTENPKETTMGMVYYHYLGVFINMRYYWPKYIWHVWRILYSFYIVCMVLMKYKFTFKMVSILMRALLRDSMLLNKVDRSTFEDAKADKFVKQYDVIT